MKRIWIRAMVILLLMLLAGVITLFTGIVSKADDKNDCKVLNEEISYKVGDFIKFGHYEQDGNLKNGKEEIEWEILKVEEDRVLVISKYALDCKKYNDTFSKVTWETSTLRKWLNDEFKTMAFTSEEQAKIPTVTVVNDNNPYYGTKGGEGGNNTQDQIFCLSISEIESMMGYNWYDENYMYGYSQRMMTAPTQYSINNGADVYTITEDDYISYLKDYDYTDDIIGNRGCWWWLRSPGSISMKACRVDSDGRAGALEYTYVSNTWGGVRPAMFINLSSVNPKSIELDKTVVDMYCGDIIALTANLMPDNVTETALTWTSSNPQIATVNNGVVEAVNEGTTIIIAKTTNELMATCIITVLPEGNSLYKVGDYIRFGHYEQDGNLDNGKEEIEWEVLKVESNCALVVSKYALDCKQFNAEEIDVGWKDCTLRKWLNTDFKNEAFSLSEQAKIPTVTIDNGSKTQDQVFCLSLNEIKSLIGYTQYFPGDCGGRNSKLIIEPTKYAINNGASVYTITESNQLPVSYIGRKGCNWWLRNRFGSTWEAYVVHYTGAVGYARAPYNIDSYAVRPALYIKTPVFPNAIEFDKSHAVMNYGDSLMLGTSLSPADATILKLTWSSSDSKVASVSNGVVKAKSTGKTTITAKTVNGLIATCEITVFADNHPDNIFADIKYDTWKYKAAKAVQGKGYMTGIGDLDGRILFLPDSEINRSQFVVALYSMSGKPEVEYEQKFSDVESGKWYSKQVTWASNSGIIAGNGDGTFGINGKATREQLALMFYKYAQYSNYDISVSESTTLDGFTDADKVSSWAVTAVKWAVERGIISGKGGEAEGYRIDPGQGATRIECAAMMNKFDEVYKNALKAGIEEIEEPLALPEEEMEDIIDEEDSEEEDSEEEITDEEEPSEMEPEDEADIKFEE